MTSPPNLVEYLAPYVEISVAEANDLAPYLRPVRYERGATIFAQGEVCRDLLILGRGIARAYYLHDSREVNLRLLCPPGALTSFASLATGEPAREVVAAVTDVEGFRARIVDYEEAQPGLLVQRLRRVLAEQHYLAMERRLRTVQWKSAAERYAYFREHMEHDIVTQTPNYHIASYLGVAPESLSRVKAANKAGGS